MEATKEKKQFTDYFTDFARKWVPDSYVIALVLTIVAFIMALFLTESGPFDIVIAWGKGFWTLLAFAMQMSLIVITTQALKKGIKIDYRYLCGASWTTFYIWHMGLSGSAPLLVATADHFMVKEIGVIPISQTIFHPYNLILTAVSVIAIILLFGFILPPKDEDKMISIEDWNKDLVVKETPIVKDSIVIKTPSDFVTYTPWCSYLVGLMFVVYLYYHFFVLGKSLDINVLNFMFLTLIIFLYGTPAAMLKAVKASTSAAWGVILQFPFYAGIYGIMKFTGLVDSISSWVIAFST